ncbi:hypothetical protein DP73_10005 [Desulfosporosinus sp. HMP52]|uniref:hypothetical protein n=1 Tax=Desulfosporosinus sp. HMP52 TaxID=1487923 RepID=UPI00051FEE95|nr:hypothetical protein [Desulfosporosinus sp. HMP52]KGK89377.1 hypothetical protein DP73_10005 [Desulfosporosinus sp. HMP52]
MKIKAIFDSKCYSSKPNDAGRIMNNTSIEKMQEYSIKEIKENILQGKTIRPSNCGSKEESWLSQQMFMIDVDDNLTIEQAIVRCDELDITPNFIYTTFSHTEEHHKFRLAFVIDREITDFQTAKRIHLYLMRCIGESDASCKNLNKIYFAGKSIPFDSGNVLDASRLIELSMDIRVENMKRSTTKPYIIPAVNSNMSLATQAIEETVANKLSDIHISTNILSTQSNEVAHIPDRPTYNIKAIADRDVAYLKEKINNKPIVFENASEFWSYVYREIDMANLLELKKPSSFKCIFHKDNNPSASIFRNDEGIWLYRCNSSCCKLTLNVKQLIEKLGNFKSEYRAVDFIKNIYNLSIKETNWSIEQKANLDSILQSLTLNKFEELCPQTHKNIRHVKELFVVMIGIAKDNVYGENYSNSDGDAVFFVSLSELARITKVSFSHLNRISQRLTVLAYHDLIRKLDDDKIPATMLKRAQAISIDKGIEKRVNFYSIPSWVFQHLKNVENQGENWKKYGYTIKATSYEAFFRAEGLTVAQKMYPQHKKTKYKSVDYETGEIITTTLDRTTSKASNQRVEKIVSSIKHLITDKGWTTEKELAYSLSKEYRWQVVEIQLRKIRGELENLGFKRVRANKEIKNLFGITTKGYPFIIVKNQ